MALRGGRVAALAAESRRPDAAQLLRGRSPADALALVPRLFSLCGKAQAAACRAACAAAAGAGQPVSERDGTLAGLDDARLAIEAGQEHLWRLLLDWPRLYGLPPREPDFVVWHKRLTDAGKAIDTARASGDSAAAAHAWSALTPLADALADFLDAEVFGPGRLAAVRDAGVVHSESWAGVLLDAARAWPAPAGGAEVSAAAAAPRTLPHIAAADWLDRLNRLDGVADDFAARPRLDGLPVETGALARRGGHPLVVAYLAEGAWGASRLAARLLDLAWLPVELATPSPRIDAAGVAGVGGPQGAVGRGVACVETARGLLIHAVRLVGDRIEDYSVIAPTEWNFHPDGAWRDALRDRPVADPVAGERLLRRVALALDPCVPVSAEVVPLEDGIALPPGFADRR